MKQSVTRTRASADRRSRCLRKNIYRQLWPRPSGVRANVDQHTKSGSSQNWGIPSPAVNRFDKEQQENGCMEQSTSMNPEDIINKKGDNAPSKAASLPVLSL